MTETKVNDVCDTTVVSLRKLDGKWIYPDDFESMVEPSFCLAIQFDRQVDGRAVVEALDQVGVGFHIMGYGDQRFWEINNEDR